MVSTVFLIPSLVTDEQVNQLNQLIELTRSELKRDDRQRIMSLITIDAHARDIVLMLIREKVTDKVSNTVAFWQLVCFNAQQHFGCY